MLTVATIPMVAVAPGPSELNVTVRLFPKPPQTPLVALHDVNVVSAGKLSITTTFVLADGPLLVTVIAYVIFEPGKTGSGESVMETDTSEEAGASATNTHWENSDVLPEESVAVAVMNWPAGIGAGKEMSALIFAFPLLSVVTIVKPTKCCPSP